MGVNEPVWQTNRCENINNDMLLLELKMVIEKYKRIDKRKLGRVLMWFNSDSCELLKRDLGLNQYDMRTNKRNSIKSDEL